METKEFRLKPEKQKKRGNWKGKLAAALAGVLGASVIGPAIASFMPETADAAETILYKNAGDPGEIRAGGASSRQDYNGDQMTVVRSAEQLRLAIQTGIDKGWTSADKELVIFVDNSMTTTYNDGSYDKDSGELNCFVMDKTIEIPANANIRLVSTAGNNVKFVRTSDFSGSDSMFRVKGKLTVGENITMSGELATKTEDVAETPGQQGQLRCADGTEAKENYYIKSYEYVQDPNHNGVADGTFYSPDGNIYNSAGQVLAASGEFGTTSVAVGWSRVSLTNVRWVDARRAGENKAKWTSADKTISYKPYSEWKSATTHYLKNADGYMLVAADDGNLYAATPDDLGLVANGGDVSATVKGYTQLRAHVEIRSNKITLTYYGGSTYAQVISGFSVPLIKKPVYWTNAVCDDNGTEPTLQGGSAAVPAGKKYGNSTAHTWDKSSSDGNYLNNNTGFFITQESGELTIDGGTFKDFNTIAGEGTYSKQPLGCAPIYVTNGKFTMNSGNIVNNTVGYTIGEDANSGKEAQDIKNHVQTKPETYTAGAIIFTGGSDHQLNGGLIAGNKADAGAIIVKTKNNHRFASDPSFSGHNQLATWAASAAASSTRVTMGAGTSAGPVIAGNVGIHDSGAVFVWPVGDNDTAEVVMNAGKVQDNFSWYKGGAFNVCSEIDPIEHWEQDKKRANAKAIFDMNGGLIENNTAVCRGGAIEVVSDQVYLKAGIIRDNNSRTLGGAIYVEGDFADRLYTLYLPNTYVNNNNAWKETKAGQEASDYAYLKRKLVSGNRARLNADGTYTYDNPLGNVRNDNGSINDTNSNEGKKDWSPVSDGAKKWILSATRTGDWGDFPNHSGLGGGVWLCALGGYASINFFINDTNKPDLVGAYIDGNNGTKGNGQIDWDMTALAKDGGFTLSKANTNAQDQSEYVYLDRPSEHLVWNKLYSGKGARYDIVNSNNITTDNTQGGTKGVLITQNNARAGGGIASNGTVIFGQSGDIYRHSAETTFTKTWTGVTSKPMAFQAYIIKNDGTKVAIPGYQFILDGTAGDAQGGNGSVQSVVDETSGWTAKIQLPYGYDGTPVFEMTANNKTYDTLMTLWDIPGSVTTGTVTDWNFAVEEVPSLPHKKTGLVASNNYFLLKKVDENSGSETDRDPNFKTDGKYDAPINIGAQTEWPYTNFPDNYKSGLYFVKQYNGVTEVNETLFNGEYALVQGNGNVIEEFTISEGETEFASYNLVEKPSTVKLSQTHKEVDYKDKEGKTITKIHEYSTKAYTEGDNNNLKMDNSEREKPGVEKYINKKVDQDLDNIGQQFTYDIIAKVPDQAEEFAISDTLVDWIEYVGGTEAIQIKVLDNNDHLGNGSGTVATGKVNNTGNSVVNQALTSQVNAACEKIILNDTLTVRVTDKTVLKNLIGKYVQITINAQLDSKHYDDVMGKVASSDRQVTYNDNTVAYALKNDFDKENYTYRLYKVSDTATDGLVAIGSQKAGDFLTESEVKALGISADTKLVRSGRLAIDGSVQASFDPSKKAFTTLSAGKYVLHVMEGKIDDGSNGQTSRDKAVLKRCEVFEIIDGDEDIRWVSVAGTSQNGLPEAFKNDSPYMGEGKQQTDPQVVTGNTAEDKRKDTSDDPLHDGVGNRATFAVTYRGGRQQTLKSNTVTVEPLPETPKIEKYVNKKVDDTLAGFDSNFTYDIMAYIPNGVSTVVIDDTLVDWLEFASTDNTLNQIRVLSDNDHIGNGSGTVATGSVNGNTKVVDVALDNKYTVEKTGNKLKVTINDRDTITKLWGNWVQVTFDAKIKESAYGAVVSKLNEKTDENDNRASVTYSNSQDKGTFTVNIKDTDDYYYRLYSRDQGAISDFLYKRPQNPDWLITDYRSVSAATREKFGLTDWTESARTLEFNSSNVTTQIKAANYRDYDSATGELVFKNLPTGSYFLYCFKKTGGGSEADRVVIGRCQAFEIDSKNFNWVEVDGGITFPKYLNSDTPVLDGSNAMHDGIGNRAGYTLSYGSSTVELKTNVVTVEPPKEEFEITKIWEGDNVTALTGEVETAFLNALQLKLDGVEVPENLQTLFKERLTIEVTDTDTWKIRVTLPKYQGKSNYTIREDLSLIQNDESIEQNIKDLLTGYTAKYEISLKDGKYKPDLDTEHYSYRMYRISSEGYNWSNISNEKAENTNIPESLYSMLHINKDTIVSGTVVIPDQKPLNYHDSDKSFTGLTNGKYFLYCWTKGQDEKSNPVVERCEVFEITGNNDHIIRSGNNAAGNGDIIHNTKKFEVKLKKVSSTNTSTGLTGASFSITKVRDASGNEVTDAPTQDFEAYGYDFVKSDLDPGIYRIHETKAPTGYNYLKGDFQVKINNDGTFKLESVTDGDTVTYDSEGVQFVVQDRPIELYKTLHVRKSWQNVNADEFDGNTVEIQIQSDYAKEGQFVTVNTIEINKNDNWKKDVTTDSNGYKLPLYNGTRVVNYKIVETKVKDSTGEVICDYTDNDPGDDAYVNHVEENDPFATYAVAAKTYTTTSVSVSVGNGIKALTLKSGTRNVAMNAAVSGDSLDQAKAKKQAWMAYQVSDGVMLLCQQESSTSWRYLTYAYNSGTYMLHATYSNSNTNTDEGGYRIYDYTTDSGTANRYAGWTFSNGKLSQYNSYNGAYYYSGYWNNTINYYTTYFTTTTGNVTVRKPNKTESDTVSLVGKTSSSDATTVKLQRWNSNQNKWVDATSLQNNQYYRFIIGDAAATTTTTTTNSHSPKTYELDNTNPKSTVYSLFGNDVDLTKSYSEKIISSSSDLGTYFNGKTGCMGSSDLFGVLKNILYYGYSNDAENLKTQFTLSDDDLKYLTAYAITEYTKHYTDGYTDKVDHSYGLTGPEASRVPDSGNLRAAYKKLMTLVSNTDKNLLNGVDLKLYYTGDDTDKVLLSADITSEQTAVVNSKDEMITLKGKKTWNDNGNSMNERPNFIELQLYSDHYLENYMQPLGGKITVNKPSNATGDVWEFTLGSYPKYVTMSNGEKREILYEIREVNGGSFYTLFGEIQKTTVLGASTNFKAAYGYRKDNLFRSTWANSKYFLANNNNEKINAYCLNLDKSDPSKVSSYSDGVHYTKVHIGKASDFATNNISFGTGGSGTSGYKYLGHENEADLIKRLIKIQYYGYPKDKGNLLNDYDLSPDQFIYLTQYAVWEYTNWYGIGKSTSGNTQFDFSKDKVNYSFGLSGNTKISTYYLNEVGSNEDIVSSETKQKLRNAYKALMEMIESEEYTVPSNLELYVYKPTNGNSYQALIGIEVLELGELRFDFTNKVLDEVELPHTGGMGTLWIFLIGAGAVAAAITGLAVRSRRKKNIDDNVA